MSTVNCDSKASSLFPSAVFSDGGSDHDSVIEEGFHFLTDEDDGCDVAFKRKMRFEDEKPLKKNCSSHTIDAGDRLRIKKRLNMEENIPSKRHKITGFVNEACTSPGDCMYIRNMVKLVLCPSLSTIGIRKEPLGFPVGSEGCGGVDLGAIGRALGLDPSSVRLNGYFLSRGPDLLSSVTWESMLSFFSNRGFPTGDSDHNSIVVQGKPMLAPGQSPWNHQFLKRKIGPEDERPSKINRITACKRSSKRSSSLEDDMPFKKLKTVESPILLQSLRNGEIGMLYQ